MTTATNNAKQVFLLMVEFDDDYGQFPNDASANEELVSYRGDYANDYLGQFLAGGYVQSEEIFYAEGGSRTNKKPDNVYSSRAKTLEAGECGFAYLKNMSTSANSGTPILLTPMTGKGTQFDSDVHSGKAVVLRVDGSVQTLRIDSETGEALVPGGQTLFQGGKKTPWEEKAFVPSDLLFPM